MVLKDRLAPRKCGVEMVQVCFDVWTGGMCANEGGEEDGKIAICSMAIAEMDVKLVGSPNFSHQVLVPENRVKIRKMTGWK